MSDTPSKSSVPLNNGAVKQKHRLAAGEPVTGQTLPPAPPQSKTPA